MKLIEMLLGLLMAATGQVMQVDLPQADGSVTVEEDRVVEEFTLGENGEVSFTKEIGPDRVVIEGEINGWQFRVATPEGAAGGVPSVPEGNLEDVLDGVETGGLDGLPAADGVQFRPSLPGGIRLPDLSSLRAGR
ncbi:MAG TPA: hypothetical protein VIO14_10115 [Dehalococcoidia bacterium]